MNKRSGFYPRPDADGAGWQVVSQAGGVLLTETIRAVGLDRELLAALARWRLPLAVHDPGKVVTDLAVMLALGGDCLADIVLLRAEPGVYGLVASDPRGVAHDRPARRRCPAGVGRDPHGPCWCTSAGVEAGRGARPRPRPGHRPAVDHRCGCHLGHRALR